MAPKATRTLWVLLLIVTLSQLARGEAADNEQALEAELMDLKKDLQQVESDQSSIRPINKHKIALFGRWTKKLPEL